MSIDAADNREPPPPLSFKEERILLFAQLGLAMSHWSRVEAHLFKFFDFCFQTNEQASLNLTYQSIELFRAKLQVVNRLLRDRRSDHPEFLLWEKLHGRIGSASGVRNRLAHYQVVQFRGEPGRRIGLVSPSDIYVPYFRALEQGIDLEATPPAGTLYLRDVSRAGLEFLALTTDMYTAFVRIFDYPVPKREYGAEVPPTPTVEELRKEVRQRFTFGPDRPQQFEPGSYEAVLSMPQLRAAR